jgi:hypothetical protein
MAGPQLRGLRSKPPHLVHIGGEHRRMMLLEKRPEERDCSLHGLRQMGGCSLPLPIGVVSLGVAEQIVESQLGLAWPGFTRAT